MKKVLFIDRDGTLILEPADTCQVDGWEKLEFYPEVFTWLGKIARETGFELVMVTNQDGLGTPGYPEEIFWPIQRFVIKSFANEDIHFAKVHIDKSFPKDNLPTRKPNTGMLTEYMKGNYDLENSFVIGDRLTDVKLAANLGCKAIWINPDGVLTQKDELTQVEDNVRNAIAKRTTNWKDIYEFLVLPLRKSEVRRKTKETDISVHINLDGSGVADISTGLKFFDHMLDQLARHSGLDISIKVKGDLQVDEHHTIEDTAIALGEALNMAIGDKLGMNRYGFCLPMDDCEAHVSLDFSGRIWLDWKVDFKREKVGDMPTEMFMHFFKSLSDAARMNLHIKATGDNEHHKIESIFKALARSIKMGIARDPAHMVLPSTKGTL
ncbi:MAG: bifunctional histidinol-phosphatase/imidazoleglycerol-phosphate dehydratase HisB [Flavobacteriales bacterium]